MGTMPLVLSPVTTNPIRPGSQEQTPHQRSPGLRPVNLIKNRIPLLRLLWQANSAGFLRAYLCAWESGEGGNVKATTDYKASSWG